jgi:hypothetical protein
MDKFIEFWKEPFLERMIRHRTSAIAPRLFSGCIFPSGRTHGMVKISLPAGGSKKLY